MTMLEWAIKYAGYGIPVIPLYGVDASSNCDCSKGAACKSAGKHPRIKDWGFEASTNQEVIRQWWLRWPSANIGGATGYVMDVLDVDGAEGLAELETMMLYQGALPECPSVRTGSGGMHYYFEPTGARNTVQKIAPHIDWRGTGGQVVLPPSRNAKGVYEWVVGL